MGLIHLKEIWRRKFLPERFTLQVSWGR